MRHVRNPSSEDTAMGRGLSGLKAALASALALWLAATGASAQDCGREVSCSVGGGTYRAVLPEDGPNAPWVLYLHGYSGTSEGAMQRASLIDAFLSRGMAVVAPDGQPFAGEGPPDWSVADTFDWPREDTVFLSAVIADAAERFDLDADRLLIAGYSRGGSMAWDLACRAPGLARAFASQSGAFWEPLPDACAGPVHLFHMHGLADRTVSFEGRKAVFFEHPFHQGSVMSGLDVLRDVNGCWGAAEFTEEDAHFVKRWECDRGSLTLVMGPFGHNRQADTSAR